VPQGSVGLAEQAKADHRDPAMTFHLAGDEPGVIMTGAGGWECVPAARTEA
jgi:hypothetical protein